MGSVEIASACTGNMIFGLPSAILSQILDAPKLKDLPKTVENIKHTEREKEQLKKSPLGLMFKYNK
jgi:hypothetical protein